MAIELNRETTMVPCRGCSRDIIVPKGPVIAALRARRHYILFCSARCQRKCIAKEGAKAQEEQLRVRDSNSGSSS